MKNTFVICLITLLMLNITAFNQTAKPTTAPQKIDGYIFKNSDTVLLTESNVCNLDLRLLTLARNEIYARHSYKFKDKSLQDYFNNRKWYKINASYTGKLSDIELKNVDLIKKYEEYFKKYEAGDCKGRIINNKSNFDLNGDGIIDKIKYQFNPQHKDQFTLNINNAVIKDKGDEIADNFYIIDMNENDKIKEIVVLEYGDGDDCTCSVSHFYYYDGRKIITMGKIDGLCGTYKSLNGKGTVYSRNFLFQIYFNDEYKLTSKHLLQHVDKIYYLTPNSSIIHPPVTVLKSIHLYKSPNIKKVTVKLKVGEKIDIIGNYIKKWYLVKTKTGKTGWFALDKYDKVKELGIDAMIVFDGLYIAN